MGRWVMRQLRAFLATGICLLMLVGCAEKPELTYRGVGELVSIQFIQGGFGVASTQVETTEGYYIVRFAMSGRKGAKVTIRSDGYLFIEGTQYGRQLWSY